MPPKTTARAFVAQDFRVAVGWRDQRAIQRLEHELGAEGVLAWLTLQSRVAVEAPLGRLEGWEDFDVGRAARWRGDDARLTEALEESGLIAQVDGAWELVGWAEAQPYIAEAEARSEAARRAISIRWERARSSGRTAPEYGAYTTGTTPELPEEYGAYTGGSSVVIPQPNHDQPNQEIPPFPPLVPPAVSAGADESLGGDSGSDCAVAVAVLGPQEPRTGRYKSPDEHSGVGVVAGGLAGPQAELSTSKPLGVDKSPRSWPEAFLSFWSRVPPRGRERSGRDKAFRYWVEAVREAGGGSVGAGVLGESLEAWCGSEAWSKSGGEYVPGVDRWLRDGCWRDRPGQVGSQRPGLVPVRPGKYAVRMAAGGSDARSHP